MFHRGVGNKMISGERKSGASGKRRHRQALRSAILSSRPQRSVESLEPRELLSVATMTPAYLLYRPVAASTPAATAAPTGLSPAQIDGAYGISAVSFNGTIGDGSTQTIAIIDAYNAPNISTDLHTFDTRYGLSDPMLTVINENGGASLPGTDPAGPGNSWALETSLDVEWAHAVAPKAAILLVEASSSSDSDLFAAVNTARNATNVSAVSLSWGGGEFSGETADDSFFTTPAGHTGVTFLAASGDGGDLAPGTRRVGVSYPAASPNVVGVGGTTLNVSASNAYVSESGWTDSGGGLSRIEAQPSFQSGVVTQSTSARAVPDVSIDANPASGVSVVDSWDASSSRPWIQLGGTSLATPLWAGIIAIINQGRTIAGMGTLNGATQTLPGLYALVSTAFHDVTSGNNGFAAGTGFDLVTGIGSPIVNTLAADLSSTTPTPTPTPTPSPTPTSQPIIASLALSPSSLTTGASLTLTANNVTDSGAAVTSVAFYRVTNATSRPQTLSDHFIGDGTQSANNWSLTASTADLPAGTYTLYAVATDSNGQHSAPVTATLTVTAATPTPTPTPTPGAPTIGAVSANPSSVTPGANITLTASNVTDASARLVSVTFYREADTTAGPQPTTDHRIGAAQRVGSSWVIIADTIGVAPGAYTVYAIATDSAGATSAPVTTTVTVITPAAPANDNFANAAPITGTTASVTGTNLGATKETGEPNIAGNTGGKSVWWSWTSPTSGTVALNTHGSNFDTLLGVFTGSSVSTLTTIAANDDDRAHWTYTSALTFSATAGVTYDFAVDGYNAASGSITLNLKETPTPVAPANDNFANAIALTGSTATWSGTNIGATRETGEPIIAGNAGGASVWFSWTATTTGLVSVDTHGSNFDTLLGVFTGSSVSSLTTVAANDDDRRGRTLTSAVTFKAVAGTTYYIAVDGYDGATGHIALNLSVVSTTALNQPAFPRFDLGWFLN